MRYRLKYASNIEARKILCCIYNLTYKTKNMNEITFYDDGRAVLTIRDVRSCVDRGVYTIINYGETDLIELFHED